MKASYYWLALAAAGALTVGLHPPPAFATEPGVLLLDDFQLVEGRVERFGGLYRVTAADGSTQLLNDFQVLHHATSRADAYKFVTGKIDPESAADRAKLAGWFLKVGDPDRAAIEARAAAELAPGNAQLQELVKKCEQEARSARAAKATEAEASGGRKPRVETRQVEVQQVEAKQSAPVAPDAANAFGTRVQPILMNLCATCHAHASHAGPFKLDRVPPGYANAAATTANLAAAAGQLRRDDPATSPLLTMAVTAHGGAQRPPLANRSHPAFRNLELWVHVAAGSPRPAPVTAALPSGQIPPQVNDPGPAVPTINPDDPFDPNLFNRLPKKNGG